METARDKNQGGGGVKGVQIRRVRREERGVWR